MTSKDHLKEIDNKIAEIILIEEHLQELKVEQSTQQARIAELDAELNEKLQQFETIDSTLFRLIYGKYSEKRLTKVEQIKDQYLQTALELKDYERINEALKYEEQTLAEQAERNKKHIDDLLKLVQSKDFTSAIGRPELLESTQNYQQLLQDNTSFLERTVEKMEACEEVMASLMSLSQFIAKQVKQFNPYEHTLIRFSLFSQIEDLEGRIAETDHLLSTFIKQLAEEIEYWLYHELVEAELEKMFSIQMILQKQRQGGALYNFLIDEETFDVNQIRVIRQFHRFISITLVEMTVIKSLLTFNVEQVHKDLSSLREHHLSLLKDALM